MTTECDNCGAPVSDKFARVVSDIHGEVHACPECTRRGNVGLAIKKRIQNETGSSK